MKKMTIGIAGPMTLKMINFDWSGVDAPPKDPHFPMISELINVLLSYGHRVVAFTSSHSIEKEIVYESENLTICVAKRPKKASINAATLYYRERKSLVRLMKAHPVDIMNAQWSYEFALAALDSGILTTVTLHDIAGIILKYFRDYYRRLRWIANEIVVSRSKHLIANSQYTFNALSKKQQKKAVIIPNYYNPLLEKNYTPEAPKHDYIISVATFDKRKNIRSGLLAFKIIREKYPNYKYYLLGGHGMGENEGAYYHAHQNGLAEGVIFLGKKDFNTLIPMVRDAKVVLHTSLEESFGLAILEAMIVGTPVVGGINSGNVPYLLKHRERGMLCDITNPQEIANCAMELLENESLSNQIIINAHQFAKENFRTDIVIPKLLQHYEELIQNSKKAK